MIIESPQEEAQRMRDESHRDEEMPEEIPYDQPEVDDEIREKNW